MGAYERKIKQCSYKPGSVSSSSFDNRKMPVIYLYYKSPCN